MTVQEPENCSILVVDDEPLSRELIQRQLAGAGHRCSAAASAQSALVQLARASFDLVLLDVWMPGLDGRWLLRTLTERFPDVGVIMMTGRPEMRLAIECLKCGAADFLIKPFSRPSLLAAVREADGRRAARERILAAQRDLESRIEILRGELRSREFESIQALINSLEAKDPCTKGHSLRVTRLSGLISDRLGLARELAVAIRLAATLHDVGKIGIPESILNKPGRLSAAEYEQIKCHPLIGERILQPVIRDPQVLLAVRHHHERYDGQGYPGGLKAEAVPIAARVLSIADSVDAMMSPRAYRQASDLDYACAEVARGSGSQFDPQVAVVFLEKVAPGLGDFAETSLDLEQVLRDLDLQAS